MLKKILSLFLITLSIQVSVATIFNPETMRQPELKGIELLSFSADTNTAVFNVTLYNPNLFKIPVREMTSSIFLNQQHVATLDAKSNKSLGANANATFTVPVTINPSSLDHAIRLLLNTSKAQYRLEAYLMTPVGEMPIIRRGELSTGEVVTLLRHTLFPAQASPS